MEKIQTDQTRLVLLQLGTTESMYPIGTPCLLWSLGTVWVSLLPYNIEEPQNLCALQELYTYYGPYRESLGKSSQTHYKYNGKSTKMYVKTSASIL